MGAREYCERVEREDRLRWKRARGMHIEEDGSPLVSLKEARCELQFESSIFEGYGYLVREAVFEKILRIGKRLTAMGLTLSIRSAWRSFAHQRLLWDNRVAHLRLENPELRTREIEEMASYFIAPERKSMHATGGAVDALIFDLESDQVMDFGTNTGTEIALGRKCYRFHPDIAPQARQNRRLLGDLFEEEEFVCDSKEFWHFDYGNAMWAVERGEASAKYGVIASK